MKIQGSFVNEKGNVVEVTINASPAGTDLSIEPGSDLQFADEDAVLIDSGVNDSLDAVQQHSCTLNLQSRRHVPELFSKEYKDSRVTVTRDGKTVFCGWLEPRTLSGPFNEVYDDLELHCVDCLSSLQYSPFRDVKDSPDYVIARGKADMTTFEALLEECLSKATGGATSYVYWDKSRSMPDGSDVWSSLKVSDVAFLGDDADDTKTYLDVLEAILKYLDLHVVEYGEEYYIYSWESLRDGSLSWTQLLGPSKTASEPWSGTAVVLSSENVEDMNTSMDVQGVSNQLSLTISPKSEDAVLRSPLDSSGRSYPFGGRTLYMTEYAADGEGLRAANAFWNLVRNHADINNYDGQKTWKDYYVRLARNTDWRFGTGTGPGSATKDWTDRPSDSTIQDTICDKLKDNLGAVLLSTGVVDHKPGKGDTSRQARISMSDCLVISVNGNGDDSDDGHYPKESDIKKAMPVAEYTGNEAAVFSPSDPSMTNYLVIDGTIVLAPIMKTLFKASKVSGYGDWKTFYRKYPSDHLGVPADSMVAGLLVNVSPSRNNKDGRYLAFEWRQNGSVSDNGWIPFTEDGPQEYEYKTASGKDAVDKVDILWCMLRIGDKVLVERDKETGTGRIEDFEWREYKSLSDCGNDLDTYLEQTFTIGIDPKIGDKVVGTEFPIQTNFDYSMNIDADGGMAIPMRSSDHLEGKISFEILGVDDGPWQNYHKTRHATMFRHSKYSTDAVPLMSHVSSVIIKDFSVKVYSDVENSDEDSDIVYRSKTRHDFYNKRDDLEMLIHSGFTREEIAEYSLSGKVMYTTVCGSDGLPVLEIKDTVSGETSKAEKLYVSHYYEELSEPRVVLTQTLQDRGSTVHPFGLYRHEALNKDLYVRDMDMNLMEGSATLRLEEEW